MNDFTVKKLADVQALIAIAKVITSHTTSFGGTSRVVDFLDITAKTDIANIVPKDSHELFDDAVAKATAKLTKLMEISIGDDWENNVIVLEWTCTYAGLGAARSGLVSAALRSTDSEGAFKLGNLESNFYYTLKEAILALQAIAAERNR